jgi:DNA-binding PadR family transcriptional regulator
MTERWATRTGGVPRGLLRFLVLNILARTPMSGVEIVELIDKETGGRWKPSSGSIYPLLARLQATGFSNELPDEESAMKRYTLTAKGKVFLEKQVNYGQKLLDKLEFIVPLIIGGFQFDPNDEKILSGTREPAKRVVMALLDLRHTTPELTDENSKAIEKILNKSADELEHIFKQIQEKNQSVNNSKEPNFGAN